MKDKMAWYSGFITVDYFIPTKSEMMGAIRKNSLIVFLLFH